MSAKIPAANPHVAAMSPYVPGEQPQGGGWVKLNTNENPYPPSLRSLEAIRAALVNDGAALRLYPSPDSAPMREAVARFHDFDAARVVAGNGSDDILNLIIRAYAGPGRPIGMLNPSYSLYPVLAAAQAADVVKVEVTDQLGVDVDAIAKSGASVFFLTNPNAPLGVAFTPDVVRSVAQAFPGMLVVDEAYASFADADCVALARELPNVIVTRTMSKAHALAGLRVGYALCPVGVAEILHRVRDSYNVDRLAQIAAAAALGVELALHPEAARLMAEGVPPAEAHERGEQVMRSADVILIPVIPSPLSRRAFDDAVEHLHRHHAGRPQWLRPPVGLRR